MCSAAIPSSVGLPCSSSRLSCISRPHSPGLQANGGEDYHLNGYKQLFETSNMPFTLACGLAAYVPDVAFELMFVDARAVLRVHEWQAASEEELHLLASFEPAV